MTRLKGTTAAIARRVGFLDGPVRPADPLRTGQGSNASRGPSRGPLGLFQRALHSFEGVTEQVIHFLVRGQRFAVKVVQQVKAQPMLRRQDVKLVQAGRFRTPPTFLMGCGNCRGLPGPFFGRGGMACTPPPSGVAPDRPLPRRGDPLKDLREMPALCKTPAPGEAREANGMIADSNAWRLVAGFKLYECAADGRIRKVGTKRVLKPQRTNGDYMQVRLYHAGGVADPKTGRVPSTACRVHIVIAKAWVPNPLGLPTVHHIDNDETNNAASNLRWATQSEQNRKENRDCTRVGALWRRNPVLKLDAKTGQLVERFTHLAPAAATVGVTDGALRAALKKTGGAPCEYRGFRWEYEPPSEPALLPGEVWRCWYDDVFVSNLARVLRAERIVPRDHKAWYLKVGREGKNHELHIVVATLFVPKLDPAHDTVKHKNGNKKDNRAENLEWTTRAGNTWDAVEKGHMKVRKAVVQIKPRGERVLFESLKSAAEAMKCTYQNISDAIRRRREFAGSTWELRVQ
jgi:HNH endonuclease